MATAIKYKDELHTTGNSISFKRGDNIIDGTTTYYVVDVFISDVLNFKLKYTTEYERELVIETIDRCLNGYIDLDDIIYSREPSSGGGGGGSNGIFVGFVNPTVSVPTTRIDGSPLQDEDYVISNYTGTSYPYSTLPPNSITFPNKVTNKAYYSVGAGIFVVDVGAIQDTSETLLKSGLNESISGTAVFQNQVNIENKAEFNKKLDKSTASVSLEHAYIHKADGTDGLMQINTNANAGLAIVRRDLDKQINVPLTPLGDDDATSKQYVDNNNRVDNVTIERTGTGSSAKIQVKDGGLTVPKFNTSSISITIPESGATDSKLPTEKASKEYTDKAGHKLDLSIDNTTFKVTATLKDKNNNVLSTKDITLPIEQMTISDFQYDNTNEKFVIKFKDAKGLIVTKEILVSSILKGVVTQTAAQTLTNKTIDADDNTIKDITGTNFKNQTSTDKGKTWVIQNDGTWALGNAGSDVDNITIDLNSSEQLEVKDNGIEPIKFKKRTATTDEGKTFLVQNDGSWTVDNIKQYKRVSTFVGESGNTYTEYFLDTPDTTHVLGLYVWDPVNGFIQAFTPATSGNMYVGMVNVGGSFPTERPDHTALIMGDYVKPNPSATYPYTVGTVTFTSARDTAVYMGSDNWLLNASPYQKTDEILVNNRTTESINGTSSTSFYQAGINIENAIAINSSLNNGTFTKETDGSIKLNLTDRKGNDVINTSISNVVYTNDTQILTNKTIDADDNTIKDITGTNFKNQTSTDKGKTWVVQSDGAWALGKAGNDVDNITIDLNSSEQLEVKNLGITTPKLANDAVETIKIKDRAVTINKINDTNISTTIPNTGTGVDTKLTTEKAVKDYVDIFGKSLDTINTTTEKKLRLKDKNNNILSSVDSIDISNITKDDTVELTNKTIDADKNSIKELETDNLKSGVLDTVSLTTTDDTHVASSKLIDSVIKKSVRFIGYITTTTSGLDIKKDDLWYNNSSTAMPTTFPIYVYRYNGTTWSSTPESYTPSKMDLWANKNNNHEYYWLDNSWNLTDIVIDDTTIGYNNNHQLEVKDEAITLPKFAKHIGNTGKAYVIQSNGTTALENIKQYLEVSALPLTGNTYTEYYLNTPSVIGTQSYSIGVYIWNNVSGYKQIADLGGGGGGGTSTPIFVGIVPPSGTFPLVRPNGEALILGDYVKPEPTSTFPYTVGSITFTSARDTAVYMGGTNWLLNANPYQKTSDTPINDKLTESINGASSTAVYQSDINKENVLGLGKLLDTDDVNKKLQLKNTNNTEISSVDSIDISNITKDDTVELTNKTIDADKNSIKELETDNLKAGVLQTTIRTTVLDDTTIPSEKAVSTKLKDINDRIDNLEGRGRYLSTWDNTTGLPETNPTSLPYTYKTGDYYIISKIATGTGINYKPTGTSYTGVASTVVETEEVKVNDMYIFDSTVWKLLKFSERDTTFVSLIGNPYDNTELKTELDKKVNITDLKINSSLVSLGSNVEIYAPTTLDNDTNKYLKPNTSGNGLEWKDIVVDNTSIENDNTNGLQVKDKGITEPKLADEIATCIFNIKLLSDDPTNPDYGVLEFTQMREN